LEDGQQVHRFWSAEFFNLAWDFLEKPDRTHEDDLKMIAVAQASYTHWLLREDVQPVNRSVGLWQLSRVYASVGSPQESLRYAEACWAISLDLEPFYKGYAAEAMARAKLLGHHEVEARTWLHEAETQLASVDDPEGNPLLAADLVELAERLKNVAT